MRKHRYLGPALAACVALIGLVACGADPQSDETQQVASLDTPSSAPGSTSSSPSKQDEKRPQLTVHMTKDEQTALLQAWQHCLLDHGVPGSRPELGSKNNHVAQDADKSKYPEAYEACYSMKPIPPPELDADTNPHYMDSYGKMIECMNEKGLKVEPLPNGGGWNHAGPNALSQEQENKIYYNCREKAFSDDLD